VGVATGCPGAAGSASATLAALAALPGFALPTPGSSVLAGDFAKALEAQSRRQVARRRRFMASLALAGCLV
jgi:hypothetical protein